VPADLPDTGRPAESAVQPACAAPESRTEASCFALQRTDVRGTVGLLSAEPQGFGPEQLQAAYRLPSDTAGDGELVAIVDAFDHPTAEQDLAVYRQQFGLAPCTSASGCFTKVNQRGEQANYPVPNSGWAQEISLDLDMVSAGCPRCRLLLVEADSADMHDLGQAVNTAVQLGAKYVSNSYGNKHEVPIQNEYDAYYDHPGVAITVSTGDDGYGVAFPASSPHVTAVGGTSMVADDSERGYAETAWKGAGSGCSAYEPKPDFQADPGCDHRAVADVSAVADPATGVAMYDSYQFQGWAVFGGTSASAPLIASIYALAGSPVAGTEPNTYPYDSPSALFDVTGGSNGSCDPSYLCTGGPGYDGPTGLGTPNGVAAFRTGPHGTLSGTVRSAAGPIAGARVTAGERSTVTDATGSYSVSVPVGSYLVTASAYGFVDAHKTGVTVPDGGTVTVPFTLAAAKTATVSGAVRDGSGHGWPLYAKLTFDGVPGAPVYTDPVSGEYSVELPVAKTYTMHAAPVGTGYQRADRTIPLGNYDRVQNVDVGVDPETCDTAPGFVYDYNGVAEDFTGWIGTEAQHGWSITDGAGNGDVWAFDDPGGRGNTTGGDGTFAVMDDQAYGLDHSYDTSLVSPIVDLSTQSAPRIGFRTDFRGGARGTAAVDLSIDGGASWQTLWRQRAASPNGQISLPIPQAAGQPKVQVRFHYTGYWSFWWEVDDVFVGTRSCQPLPGGLITGTVTDRNTGDGIAGATVAGTDASTVTIATPEDGEHGDGWYRLFSPETGRQKLTASYGMYQPATTTATVRTNLIRRQNLALAAGRLRVKPAEVSVTQRVGDTRAHTVTVTNTGSAPAHLKLSEQPGHDQVDADGTTASGAAITDGAAVQHVTGHFSPERFARTTGARKKTASTRVAVPSAAVPASGGPAADPWQPVADYPLPIADNGMAVIGGTVYSVGGYDGVGDTAAGYAYDPVAKSWTSIPDLSTAREGHQVAAVAGRLYVTGGWGPDGLPLGTGEVYDPASRTWSPIATNPTPMAGAAVATIGSKVYLVGGCDSYDCANSEVMVYDTGADSWTRAADYPVKVSWAACAGIDGMLYCGGGQGISRPTTKANAYQPELDSWSAIPDMPHDFWGSSYTAANGEFLVSGGIIDVSTTLTNEGTAFDPVAGTWHSLPNANLARFRGGSACGFYRVGGGTSEDLPALAQGQLLPGYDLCGVADVPWLSSTRTSVDLAPGHSITLKVVTHAADTTALGVHRAQLLLTSDTPYALAPIEVQMTVQPPNGWGRISGTVTGSRCGAAAAALSGATVWVDGRAANYTLTTDDNGKYALWLDRANNPLSVTVTADGFRPGSATVKVRPGQTVGTDFALIAAGSCG
jgi:hypothetical protein